ncbi:hypothetical protein ND861_14785 [Leptospira sp. 2 VSF19]|uniref:Lipoprotein n=1 Tax=Leptospira soteropolitanensis TaxID=2950025 RepID=A0AAW5VQS3_9LEPT|nr:hypothetical protein [Leptospira soteropolitanensis]MCW7493886.1 hypothetical protein [Leptospira soteropolitanensis]MCW7501480.1 hypothetical protein [Leptospira soteropolitanensis]MCW7523757.1 hypothetical protein [Leptospira soteropolitanensis]MCW7527621.1 hypothetical protein [Leptospira soteropolitanensis]MCW7531475.1 hypothetical protein [Leptospira soteropolitanensis]
MKYSWILIPVSLLSCFLDTHQLQKVTYPLPNGEKMLFVNTTSPSFYDSYEDVRDANHLISETLEELGYSLVIGDKVWEDPQIMTVAKDNIELFQKNLKPEWIEERSRIQIWKERATSVGANGIFLLRYHFSLENKTKRIRMLCIRFEKNEIIRFDWNWNPEVPIPFYESIRYRKEVQK